MRLLKEKSICEIDNFGNKRWYDQSGKLHRDDGPAAELSNGTKLWYKNDLLHRENGPAIEFSNGVKSWYLYNIRYIEEEYNKIIKR